MFSPAPLYVPRRRLATHITPPLCGAAQCAQPPRNITCARVAATLWKGEKFRRSSRHKSLDHLTAPTYHPPVLRGSGRPHADCTATRCIRTAAREGNEPRRRQHTRRRPQPQEALGHHHSLNRALFTGRIVGRDPCRLLQDPASHLHPAPIAVPRTPRARTPPCGRDAARRSTPPSFRSSPSARRNGQRISIASPRRGQRLRMRCACGASSRLSSHL